jgi:putative oxidoreductase
MRQLIALLSAQSGIGYLIVRVVTGLILLIAGYTKVFVYGMSTMQDNFGKWQIFLPQITGPFISFLELIGGLALVIGLFTRYVGLLFVIEFIVAAYTQWVTLGKGFAGARLDIMILVAGILLATHGAGMLSVDKQLKRWDA